MTLTHLNQEKNVNLCLAMMIDPKVTKDSKTKSLEEGIMQFIFFESENFKQKNS